MGLELPGTWAYYGIELMQVRTHCILFGLNHSFQAFLFKVSIYIFYSPKNQRESLILQLVVQFLSCAWLCNPMDCNTPGFPVHYLLEFAQIHVHSVSDANQPSHPLSPRSPPAFNLCQHQGPFQRVVLHISCQSIGASASASVLQMNIQDWCPLGLTGLSSL